MSRRRSHRSGVMIRSIRVVVWIVGIAVVLAILAHV